MGFCCCVPGCKTGYASSKPVKKIPVFGFPKQEHSHNAWLKAIPRKNWTLSKWHKVCAKHFSEDDFVTSSTDRRKKRRESRKFAELQMVRLKSTAVPSIFPNLSQYLSSPRNTRKTTCSTSSARRKTCLLYTSDAADD